MKRLILLLLCCALVFPCLAYAAENPYQNLSIGEKEEIAVSSALGPAFYSWLSSLENEDRNDAEKTMIMACALVGLTLDPDPAKIKDQKDGLKAVESYSRTAIKKLKEKGPLYQNALLLGLSLGHLSYIDDLYFTQDGTTLTETDQKTIQSEVAAALKSIELLSLPDSLKTSGTQILGSISSEKEYTAYSGQVDSMLAWGEDLASFFLTSKVKESSLGHFYDAMDLGYSLIMWSAYTSDEKHQREQIANIKTGCTVLGIKISPLIEVQKDPKSANQGIITYATQIRKALKGNQLDYYELGHDLGLISRTCQQIAERGYDAVPTDDDRATLGYASSHLVSQCEKLKLPSGLIESAGTLGYHATNITDALDAGQVAIDILTWQINLLQMID